VRKKFTRSAFPAQRFTPAARGFFFSFSALDFMAIYFAIRASLNASHAQAMR
jgi:hypothetical protein